MSKADPAILGILQAAREAEVTPLPKTILHKLVYLLDVYEAEASEGANVFTGEEWRFAHFGPFSAAVAERIDRLAESRDILKSMGSRRDDESDYELYDIARPSSSLKDLGVSNYARVRLGTDIQKYARDLPGLLDYVYFRTAPMTDAKPGKILQFDACRKRSVADYKPIEMKTLSPDALRKARERLKSMAAAPPRNFASGPFDETYYRGLVELEGTETKIGEKGQAHLREE